MSLSRFFSTLSGNVVRCELCAHHCQIAPGRRGRCGAQENRGGALHSLVYGQLVAQAIDPIEKKPLFHVLPGSQALSIATQGCNFTCRFCQNSDISQALHKGGRVAGRQTEPSAVAEAAVRLGCASIAYTYTEPTIYADYALDVAALARVQGIANVWVTNGYMSQALLDYALPDDGPQLIDAANVDLKAFTDAFYREQCGARLQPVLDNLQTMVTRGVWVEVTTLIIPGLNDDPGELGEIAAFIHDALGPSVPWHVSRFHPTYKLTERGPTPVETIMAARDIGVSAGLHHVYAGNVPWAGGEDTVCPGCGATAIRRRGFRVLADRLNGGRCPDCGTVIAGVWG